MKPETKTITLTGMTCGGCVGAVKRILAKHGAPEAEVDLESGTATVPASVNLAAVRDGLADGGYKVTSCT